MNNPSTMTSDTAAMQHYAYQPPPRRQRLISIACSVLGIALLLYLIKTADNTALRMVCLLLVLWISYTERAFIWQKSAEDAYPAIDADDDGLWQAKRGKAAGLVRWGDGVALRDRWGRLDVLDAQGNRLIGVSKRLTNVEKLAERLFLAIPADEGARAARRFDGVMPHTGQKHFRDGWRVLYAPITEQYPLIFMLAAFWNGATPEIVYLVYLALPILAGIILYIMLCQTDYGVDITPGGITIRTLLRRKHLRWTDIAGIYLAPVKQSTTSSGAHYPAIQLLLRSNFPIATWDKLLANQPPFSNQVVYLHCGGRMPAALFQALRHGWAEAGQQETAAESLVDQPLPQPPQPLHCRLLDRNTRLWIGGITAATFLFFVLLALVPTGWLLLAAALGIAAITLAGIKLLQRYLNSRYSDIDADDEGLWPVGHEREQSLIHWADITRWQQTSSSAPLILYAADGRELLRLSPWLSDFAGLCSRLVAHTAQPVTLPFVWRRKKTLGHPMVMFAITGCLVTAAAVAACYDRGLLPLMWFALIVGGMLSLICTLFPTGITIDDGTVAIRFTLRPVKQFRRSQIRCTLTYNPINGYGLLLLADGKPLVDMRTSAVVTLDLFAQIDSALHSGNPNNALTDK